MTAGELLFWLVLALCVAHVLYRERHHPMHEDCQACGLWIGDPAWEGLPRVCPGCGAPMLDIPEPSAMDADNYVTPEPIK